MARLTYQRMIDAGLLTHSQAVRNLVRTGHQIGPIDALKLRVFLGVSVKGETSRVLRERRRSR
jgi:hypothetical protein